MERDRLGAELAEARTTLADRQDLLDRADATADTARTQLADTRTALEAATTRAEQAATYLAAAREQLTGARTAIADEKAHSTQRLADQRDAYEAQLDTARTRRPPATTTPPPAAGPQPSDRPARTRGRRSEPET